MKEWQITKEIIKYVDDSLYNYAVLIDGEWGSGKTYYVENNLILELEKHEQARGKDKPRGIKYLSLFGLKSTQDIQSKIASVLSDKIKEKLNINNNTTFKRIGNTLKEILLELKENKIPGMNFFDAIRSMLDLSKYIFIVDDLERCDCDVNEVLGFFNDFIEHNNSKIIFVANEEEISKRQSNNLELQYLVAANKDIVVVDENSEVSKSKKLDIELLNDRKEKIFDDINYSNEYAKYREKLIGITFKYEPNIYDITREIIGNIEINEEYRKLLLGKNDYFLEVMNENNHHNIRTFLFFISKMQELFNLIINRGYDKNVNDYILNLVVEECFFSSIIYKGNIKPPRNRFDLIFWDSKKRLHTVEKYINQSTLEENEFYEELDDYIKEYTNGVFAKDDPYINLQSGYWNYDQSWVETQLKDLTCKIKEGRYSNENYSRMIAIIVKLEEIGFSTDDTNIVISAIKEHININEDFNLDREIQFSSDARIYERLIEIRDSINEIYYDQREKESKLSIVNIIESENWTDLLEKYIEENEIEYYNDFIIFSRVSAEEWMEKVNQSSPKQIMNFAEILRKLFPTNYCKLNIPKDIKVLSKIERSIKPVEEGDIIKRHNLEILKDEINGIKVLYKQE